MQKPLLVKFGQDIQEVYPNIRPGWKKKKLNILKRPQSKETQALNRNFDQAEGRIITEI